MEDKLGNGASLDHYPFVQKLYVGPGYPSGRSNIQRATDHYPMQQAVVLVPPNGAWRCVLVSNIWYMCNASQSSQRVFELDLTNADRLIIEPDGLLHIVDAGGADLVQIVGPFGDSASYSLNCEDQGDVALYNAAGQKLWSAVVNGFPT